MQLVTIILTTLNSERFLARSIDSCLNQTYCNLELLIVDGGSTDHTLDIVASYYDFRIRVIHQQNNSGKLPGALNLGMAHAKGEFITWTQDDSWYEPNAIEVMVSVFSRQPEVGLVYADYRFVDENEQVLKYQPAGPPEQIADGGDIVGQCFLFRRQVYEAVGPQDETYFPVHEIPWRIRVARSFVIRPVHQALMYYTLHAESLTGKIGPWQLRYMTADALLHAGFWDNHRYRQRVAQIHVNHAYDEFVLHGHYTGFWRHVVQAARLDAKTLSNRGTWKLMVSSVLPNRESLRQNALARWRATEAQQQQRLKQAAHA